MKVAVRRTPRGAESFEPTSEGTGHADLLQRLESICAERGLGALGERLADLADFVSDDILAVEADLAAMPRHPHRIGNSASHLLDLGGKRLRPICVTLASRVGPSSAPSFQIRDLAVAVELVHSATLLHDDVIDMGAARRGALTSRELYGNAASIFAGDWLLIEALRRVQRSGSSRLLVQLFDTIEEMIHAEAIQLENRGRINGGREAYFQVAEGKTASVFRWAMSAGGQVGGVDEEALKGLEGYGLHLGVAFQATDDLLDLTGDPEATGKALFTDLREGKMTYPLIVALERDEGLRSVVEEIVTTPLEEPIPEPAAARVIGSLRQTQAVEDCLELARRRAALAVAALEAIPRGRAEVALTTVAESIVDRNR